MREGKELMPSFMIDDESRNDYAKFLAISSMILEAIALLDAIGLDIAKIIYDKKARDDIVEVVKNSRRQQSNCKPHFPVATRKSPFDLEIPQRDSLSGHYAACDKTPFPASAIPLLCQS